MPDYPLKALTLRQPWAWAVEAGGKRVENRGWVAPLGPLWLHAGARSRWDEDGAASPLVREAWEQAGYPLAELNPETELITFGAVTALISLTSVHHATSCASDGRLCDRWAVRDQVHHQVTLTRVLPAPVPARGMPRLWKVPAPALAEAAAQLTPPPAPRNGATL